MKKQLAATICLVALGSALLTSCFSQHSDSTEPTFENCPVPSGAEGAGKAIVRIQGYDFSPDTLRVARGTLVTWVNCDQGAGLADPHTSTSDTGEWSSPLFAQGQTFARVFDRNGLFPYHCNPHPAMRAVISVQ